MQESPQNLNPLFFQTWFICEWETVPESFYILTGANPDSIVQTEAENAALNARLLARLTELELTPFPVQAGSKDRSHIEESFGIECSLERALELCNEFEQDALFSVENHDVFIIDRTGTEKQFMSPWPARQL